jgi:glycosyltransferase involved in cell wall biosynthesis
VTLLVDLADGPQNEVSVVNAGPCGRRRSSGGVSVLIPAHNEASVIRGCLHALIDQTIPRAVRLIVVANGCSDDTAAIARTFIPAARLRGFELMVFELSKGSKPDALNFGDLFMLPGVRLYVDADVRLSRDALEGVAAELESGRCHLCAPALQVEQAGSAFTRSYAKVWQELPVVRFGVIGCGLYAVSEAGRRRWSRFPSIISDDKFVRLSFAPHERRVASRGAFRVQMPEGLRELTLVRGRWCRGNRDLARQFPEIARREPNRYLATIAFLLTRPDLWPSAPGFILVFVLGHLAALHRAGVGIGLWERANGARRRIAEELGRSVDRGVAETARTAQRDHQIRTRCSGGM